ncbi:hypothetical protein [Streptomyces lanatus]|uniref:Uncharacterized protein n=1 Tax=Streptomyces lanatus TaxID=66900 RepID=A0ABV1Y792_9ACTN|nr:hypothetical protein [Streptomyces lanatus]GHH29819.1 hypothetical protein GCM10018780_88360 [Streptomyces lanatus]
MSGHHASPDSVQQGTLVNDSAGAVLVDAENVRQGIPLVLLSPHNVNRDHFINRG